MHHLFVRLWRHRVLLADVHESPDGQGVGYGMMLIRMRRVLLLGQMTRAHVLFVPSRKALNTAVTCLQSDDVTIIPPGSWTGRWLTVLWWVASPFRIGDPWLWTRCSIASVVVGPLYSAIERSTWLPRRVRRFLMRQGPFYRTLKKVIAAYASRATALWQRVYGEQAIARLRALEEAGEPVPPVRLRLPADRERQATREAATLGISLTAPVVTVHVRECGYRSSAGLRQRGWDDIRNANIESFLPAFSALVTRGYTVVRLGDRTMTPVTLDGVVDLATSHPHGSEWLDIWGTMRSEFLIGCDSGPSWLAVLLGVPVLTVNAVHFRDLARPTDRIICKLARHRTTGKTLSVSDMLTADFLREGFKGNQYAPIDNTPGDIRRATIDMIEVVHGRERRSSWQNRFNRRLRDAERQSWGGRSALEGVVIFGRARGTLSRGFAKEHFLHLDEMAGQQPEPKATTTPSVT